MHNRNAGDKTVRVFAANVQQARTIINKATYNNRGWIVDSSKVFQTSNYYA
jgi:hypothetical protein